MNKFVSVIIPVYNDPERVKLCIDALQQQTYPDNLYEIIVVDNNSEPPLDPATFSKYPNVVLTHEKKQSSYAARNKGISVAKGEILAFTDADCIPEPDWIENGVKQILKLPEDSIVGGRVICFISDKNNPTSFELWEHIFSYNQERNIKTNGFVITANLFARERSFQKVGMFNGDLSTGGDRDWSYRTFNKGYKLYYINDVIVKHPARRTFRSFYRRLVRLTGAKKYSLSRGSISLKKYLFDSLILFIPPLVTIYNISQNEKFIKLSKTSYKLKIIGVCIIARYIRGMESLRLLLGGNPKNY